MKHLYQTVKAIAQGGDAGFTGLRPKGNEKGMRQCPWGKEGADMMHCWPLIPFLPQASAARRQMAEFIVRGRQYREAATSYQYTKRMTVLSFRKAS
jgi:hypothetical protein